MTDAHRALFYRDVREYLDGVVEFLEPALPAGDPVLLAIPAPQLAPVVQWLDRAGAAYELLDMAELGPNPARIIPAVSEILARHEGRTLYYVGQAVRAGRSRREMREAARHEALFNLAWPGAAIRILCPYDEAELDPAALAAAEATHPVLVRRGCCQVSRAYREPAGALPDEELEPPPPNATELCFGLRQLPALRRVVRERARRRGLSAPRAADLTLAVDELASNAIRYAEGRGRLRVWDCPEGVVCEVADRGHIEDPLAGLRRPRMPAAGGIGLWAVNQLCDLVELRSREEGTVVRVHMSPG